jgi:glutathione S-transferase
MARLEGHFAGRDWLVGDRFTVADLMVAECMRYGSAHKPMMAEHPKTAAWLARCQSRPAFQKMMTARLAEPV